jgi:hypothetical protein
MNATSPPGAKDVQMRQLRSEAAASLDFSRKNETVTKIDRDSGGTCVPHLLADWMARVLVRLKPTNPTFGQFTSPESENER